ncbi:response regulator transcription factor [Variovorax sp. YR216]|uniref:response regulator transcription factor n=1 Tax=Variovorax sp. YR216 TaxID=1882828 RepID=UPI000899FDD6|nr:LuxR C-terminal-related transcriptional regulator [Variovorax sp. YR216]SEB25194.1 Two-component response regulator, FixJ family, consists of REC and HTH domains [Variovorax sp. YR216]
MLDLNQSDITSVAPVVRLVEAEGAFRLFSDLRQALESKGYRVVTFGLIEELVLRQPGSPPGCIVLGVESLGAEGLELHALLTSKSDLPVILVTSSTTAREVVRAMKQGAADFFCKPFNEQALLSAVDKAVADHKLRVESRVLQEDFELRRASLSPRELEVYEMLVHGASTVAICESLGLAERTLKHHRSRVMEKLGFRSIVQLVRAVEGRHG